MSSSTTHLDTPASLLGAPSSSAFEERGELIFDRVPFLSDLLPKWGGQPGYIYAQVCTKNLRRAQEEGWKGLADAMVYTIQGPLGMADMVLLTRGNPIPGQSPDSGARLCGVDPDVPGMTGLTVPRLGGEEKTDEQQAKSQSGGGKNSPSKSGQTSNKQP